MQYTKEQILSLIADKILDNSTKKITPKFVRDVLIPFTDMIQSANFISLSESSYLPTIINVQQAVNYFYETNIPEWSDRNWPNKYFVFFVGNLYRSNDVVSEGENDPSANEKWELYSPGGGTGILTPEDIAEMLNSIIVLGDMVLANRIKFDNDFTVYSKIQQLEIEITSKQAEIFSKRIIFEGEISSLSLSVDGYIHPIQLAVNRVPYVGKQGASFDGVLAGFDFRYTHSGNVTNIVTNPAFNPRLSFHPGDIIDIIHSTIPLKEGAEG